jgi:hypothetical protein
MQAIFRKDSRKIENGFDRHQRWGLIAGNQGEAQAKININKYKYAQKLALRPG